MHRQIPGFYYDEEKKRYFKVQPNHAVPAGSAYSADGVKRRKVEQEAALETARDTERRKYLIRRARILQDPLLGGSLSREHGHEHRDVAAHIYIQGWDGAEILQSEASPNEGLFGYNGSTRTMGAFDFDLSTRSLFFANGAQTLSELVESHNGLRKTNPYSPTFRRADAVSLAANRSPITSIDIEPNTRLILATWQAPNFGYNVHVSKLLEEDSLDGFRWPAHGPTIVSRIEHSPGVLPTLWSATHGVQGSPFIFAIAADHGIITIDQTASLWVRPRIQTSEHRSAILAVGCLAQHPSVILGGARNGNITSFDVRLRDGQFHSDESNIKHPSAVCQIRQLNDNVIVVAGLNSTLCNYDIRFIQQRPRDRAWPEWDWTSKPGPDVTGAEITNPVLIYPEHRNEAHMDLGFDVDPEAGIIAAVQDDNFNTTKIFSSKTGHILQSLDTTFAGSVFDMASVKAVRFVEDQGSGYMKSLWVAKGTKMIRYGW